MKINSISLKNFRNHKSRKIEFTSGINLLLGKNGSGKSSFLEALGIAMFGLLPRDGSDLKDAIAKGQNDAEIIVDFTGNDGIDYLLERRLSPRKDKLFVKGESKSRLSDHRLIKDKIAELSFIGVNNDSIFKNIITAEQNQITNIFLGTDSERRKIFNKIFNTEIYSKMSDGFIKDAIAKYNTFFEINQSKLNELNLLIKDETELLAKKNCFTQQIDELTVTKYSINEQLNSINDKIEVLKQFKNDLSSTLQKITNKQELHTAKLNENSRTKSEIDAAKNSEKIVLLNLSYYHQYVEKNDEYIQLNYKIMNLEEIKKLHDDAKDNLVSFVAQFTRLTSQKESTQNQLIQFDERLSLLNDELSTQSNDCYELQYALTMLGDKINHFKNILNENEQLKEEKNKLIIAKSQVLSLLHAQKNEIISAGYINERIKILSDLRIELEMEIGAKRVIENEILLIKQRIEDNQSAKNELSSGECSILKEECKNIKNGTSAHSFFEDRIMLFEKEIDLLNDKLNKFIGKEEKLKDTLAELTLANNQIKNNQKLEQSITEANNQILLIDEKINSIDLKLDIIKLNAIKDNQDINETPELNIFIENITLIVEQMQAEYHSKNGISDEFLKRIESLKKEMSKLNKEIQITNAKLEKNSTEIEVISNAKIELEKAISKYSSEISDLPNYKQQASEIHSSLQEIKDKYESYVKNKNLADRLPAYEQQHKETNIEIGKLSCDINDLNKLLFEQKGRYDEENLSNCYLEQLALQNKLEETNGLINQMNLSLGEINSIISENERKTAEKQKLDKANNILSKKIELAKIFRKNVNSMGQLVSSRLTEQIEVEATENYRQISGTSDRVLWSAADSYQVSLQSSDDVGNTRNFNVLSGGEQISLALSLRSAMASLFADARFAIFDEPTVNLDSERRAALSESLSVILKDLEQVIIVTHDDTFRDLASKTIVLD